MPQNPETVAPVIAQLGGSKLMYVGEEVKALPEILQDGELLLAIASGRLDHHTHLLAITDSRLLVLLRRVLSQSDFEIFLAEVRSINVKSGMFTSELEINAGGQIKKLVTVDKQLAQNVAQAFSRLRSNASLSANENASVSADHSRQTVPSPEVLRDPPQQDISFSTPQAISPSAQTKKKRPLWLKACVVIAIAFAIFVAVILGKKREPTIPQDMQTELRALYLDFEKFFNAGKLQQEGWVFTKERGAWMNRLRKMGGGLDPSEVDPKATEAVRNVAQDLHVLEVELDYTNNGRFDELKLERLKSVLNAIRTGPSDNIGADMLQLAAQHVAQATPEEKAMVQEKREARQREQDKPRLAAAIKKLHKDITEVAIHYLDDRQQIDIVYIEHLGSESFYMIGETAKGILQEMTEDGLVGETTDVTCHIRVPTMDQYGNTGTSPGLSLTWDGTTLGKINWKNMFGPQLLNLCTRVDIRPI